MTGNASVGELVVPHVPWEHDHAVGLLVDVDKGVVQFFYDRKKVGPTVHLNFLGKEVFLCVAIDQAHAVVKANWTASAPKVYIGN